MSIHMYLFMAYRALGILISCPGIEPIPPAVEGWSLNHWTAREVLVTGKFKKKLISILKHIISKEGKRVISKRL